MGRPSWSYWTVPNRGPHEGWKLWLLTKQVWSKAQGRCKRWFMILLHCYWYYTFTSSATSLLLMQLKDYCTCSVGSLAAQLLLLLHTCYLVLSPATSFVLSYCSCFPGDAQVLHSCCSSSSVAAFTTSWHRQLLPQTRFLESFLEYVHSFRYQALRPTFTGPVFLRGSSGVLG